MNLIWFSIFLVIAIVPVMQILRVLSGEEVINSGMSIFSLVALGFSIVGMIFLFVFDKDNL